MFKNQAKLFLVGCIGFCLFFSLQNFGLVDAADRMKKNSLPTDKEVLDLLEGVQKAEHSKDHNRAIDLYTELIPATVKKLGEEHEQTIFMQSRLVNSLMSVGKYIEALPTAWKIYKLQKKKHGDEHEGTLDALFDLGRIHMMTRKFQKAEELFKMGYRLTKAQLGQNHTKTVKILYNLAHIYRASFETEKLELSLRYYKKVYDVWANDPEMGEEHDETLEALRNIGNVLSLQKKPEEAAEVYRKVLEIRTRTLGKNHPSTQEAKKSLYYALSNAGQPKVAKAVLGKIKDISEYEDGTLLNAVVATKTEELAKMGQWAEALEILTEFYSLEIEKDQMSFQILKVLEKIITYNEKLDRFDQILKWTNIVFDLVQIQGQGQIQRVKIDYPQHREDFIALHFHALKSAIDVHILRYNEDKIDLYFDQAVEVTRGHECPRRVLESYAGVLLDVAHFKFKTGKIDQAFQLYKEFSQNQFRRDRKAPGSISSLVKKAVDSGDYKLLAMIALSCLHNVNGNPSATEPESEEELQVRVSVAQHLLDTGNDLSDLTPLKDQEDAFLMYKALATIWPTSWIQDGTRTQMFLEGITNAALNVKRFEEGFFYLQKLMQASKTKLKLNEEGKHILDQVELETLVQQIEDLETLESVISNSPDFPEKFDEFKKSHTEHPWTKINLKQPKKRIDTQGRIEL